MLSLYEQLGGHKFIVATGSKFTGYAEDKNGNLEQYISPFIAAIFVHCLGTIPVLEKKEEEDNETEK